MILTSRLVLALKSIVLDAELNSTLNGEIFKVGHHAKKRYLDKNIGFDQNTGFFILFY